MTASSSVPSAADFLPRSELPRRIHQIADRMPNQRSAGEGAADDVGE